ncbi:MULTISPECIES: hypothetical protein [Pseudonocardia]|uniref:Uncharacterized protein n=2 Tax=Pseudonocardia TaxID=1847 RepID=A0A1Y2MSA3_PSEAH|nr:MULTISPECIES: hypothetical protein [Pseudonocardia]OSY38103.1 hypothetical protein BG845_04276 [Pseudonocardia autotrophica]TDN75544.1 hypothetical protein C8E95_4721 [Pseudonocardia autotrophica]BBF99514.1 hypothetical protein Pdca_07240 [Pseudonocardia autotrophica]GEC28515.1 hypothetical protein PSA01_55440 [Pseudonocardia saturnea]
MTAVLLAAVLVVPVAVLVLVVLPGDPSPAGVLSVDDRAALADPGPERGPDPRRPAVPPSSPEAVARAYLVAAHGAAPDPAERTRRDAVGYATPAGGAGFPVLDPPGAGERRIAVVDALEPAGTDPVRGRVAFVAEVRTTTAALGATPRTERWRTRVVLHRDPAGRWLVAADTPITPDTPDVGD